jgi:hypothetical protein
LLQVNARYLPSPHLGYSSEFGQPKNGAWNLVNTKFKDCATLKSFGICSFSPENAVGRPGPEGFPVDPPLPPVIIKFLEIRKNGQHALGLALPLH